MWLDNYNKKILFYDLIYRSPFEYEVIDFRNFLKNQNINIEICLTAIKEKDSYILNIINLLKELSFLSKVNLKMERLPSGKKIQKFNVKFSKIKVSNFLDFFLNFILKGLKRRFIPVNFSINDSGILRISFSSIGEIEVNDFLNLEVYDLSEKLNIFFNFSANSKFNLIMSLYLSEILNLEKLKNYEIFIGKR